MARAYEWEVTEWTSEELGDLGLLIAILKMVLLLLLIFSSILQFIYLPMNRFS